MPICRLLVGNFAQNLELLTFDDVAKTLKVEKLTDSASYARYTWLAPHPQLSHIVYGTRVGEGNGTLSLFQVKCDADGHVKVERKQNVTSGGVDPCHCGISPVGTEVAIANVRYLPCDRLRHS